MKDLVLRGQARLDQDYAEFATWFIEERSRRQRLLKGLCGAAGDPDAFAELVSVADDKDRNVLCHLARMGAIEGVSRIVESGNE